MIKVNGSLIQFTKFPIGEIKLEVPITKVATIEWHFESCEELVFVQFIAKHLRQHNTVDIFLIMPYIPFARMDRVKSAQEVFTLKYFCEIINSLNFTCVYVAEPHSDVAMGLLDRVYVIYSVTSSVHKVLQENNFSDEDILMFPDAGAQKRYSSLKYPQVVGHKNRDWKTGEITSLEIFGTVPKNGFKALIVDDLCSFGGTFLHSAKKLRELGASEVYLLVGHCEESVLHGELIKTDLINKIYTTDSIFKQEHEKITIVERF